jgi:hypothetical protein
MELTININVSERFCDAIELLAAAISKSNETPFIGNMTPTVKVTTPEDKVATSGDKVASTAATPMPENPAIERLKRELDLEEVKVESITITADMLRDKMQAILQKDPDRALDVKGSLLNLGAERISELDQVKYAEFYSELTAIEKEVAA